MVDVLSRIVARKREEVRSAQPPAIDPAPTTRSLAAAIARPGARFIMEVKRKSPSGHVARYSLRSAINAYRYVADALSVLVDGEDFGGSLDDLRAARKAFDGPILAKEFIVQASQVAVLRDAGADAVLVMMSVLDDPGAAEVMAAARALAMDCLVEVRDEDELARALALGASLIGINNRDLKSLEVDLETTERLASRVPPNVLVVSESGIRGRADAVRLAPRVDGFLVGSSLMSADDIDLAARSLVFGQVKICGLTRIEDVASAGRAGATHAGFIFHPRSPRRIDPQAARTLVGVARNAGMKAVGVFAGDDPLVADISNDLGLDFVQLHGPFDADLKRHLRTASIVAVRSISDGIVAPKSAGADVHLFDHAEGGSGKAFNWSLIAGSRDVPESFLAGGLNPGNASDAAALGFCGLDLSSGIESAPGIKDSVKIDALFAALRPDARSQS